METRNCKRCGGTGKVEDLLDKMNPRPCMCCGGLGVFDAPDENRIRLAITASSGKNKGKLRGSRPNEGGRAYYVWRMARFHGGVDVTMPFNASLEIRGDAFEKELGSLSERIAKESFGTDMAAAYRWGRAFGMV